MTAAARRTPGAPPLLSAPTAETLADYARAFMEPSRRHDRRLDAQFRSHGTRLASDGVLVTEPPVGCGVDYVWCADALTLLRALPDASVDAVITDPPYPGALRQYGTWTEREWRQMMYPIILETRRVLRPNGSAVLIVQPNSEHVGQMRSWVWDLMSWACRKWNIVQDAYWWNFTPFPTVHAHRDNGLMRPSVKNCIWLGSPTCYRDQSSVLWSLSDAIKAVDLSDHALRHHPSGGTKRPARCAEVAILRDGSTPPNLIPISNGNSTSSGGAFGHGAATPLELVDWWMRYIVPVGGLVVDPFMGSGTTGLSARRQNKHFIGCDRDESYVTLARTRLANADPYQPTVLPTGAVQPSLFQAAPR